MKNTGNEQQQRHEAQQDREDARPQSTNRAVVQCAYPAHQECPGADAPNIMQREHPAPALIDEDVAAGETLVRIAGDLNSHPDRYIARAGYIHEDDPATWQRPVRYPERANDRDPSRATIYRLRRGYRRRLKQGLRDGRQSEKHACRYKHEQQRHAPQAGQLVEVTQATGRRGVALEGKRLAPASPRPPGHQATTPLTSSSSIATPDQPTT